MGTEVNFTLSFRNSHEPSTGLRALCSSNRRLTHHSGRLTTSPVFAEPQGVSSAISMFRLYPIIPLFLFFLPQPSNAPRGGWILLLKFFCLFAFESPNRQKLSALKILCYPREKIPQFYATLLGEANRNSGRRLVMNWVAPSPASGSLPISPDIMASWKTRKDEGTENNERVIKATGR